MKQIDLLDRYPDHLKSIIEINNSEDIEVFVVEKDDIPIESDGEIRLFGFFESNVLRKMTLISFLKPKLYAVDYYLSEHNIIYVTESIDVLGKQGEPIENESKYSRYIFKDKLIQEYVRDGHKVNAFPKSEIEKKIIKEVLEFSELLRDKRLTNSH